MSIEYFAYKPNVAAEVPIQSFSSCMLDPLGDVQLPNDFMEEAKQSTQTPPEDAAVTEMKSLIKAQRFYEATARLMQAYNDFQHILPQLIDIVDELEYRMYQRKLRNLQEGSGACESNS
jgi:hypothetical protein